MKSVDRGAFDTYTDSAIETMGVLKFLFHLAGRQTEGFLRSISELMKLKLAVPDHSTLSGRMTCLEVMMPVKKTEQSRHIGRGFDWRESLRRRRVVEERA